MKAVRYLGIMLIYAAAGCGVFGNHQPTITVRNDCGEDANIVFGRDMQSVGDNWAERHVVIENHDLHAGGSFTVSVVESDPPEMYYFIRACKFSKSGSSMTQYVSKKDIPAGGQTYSYNGTTFVVSK